MRRRVTRWLLDAIVASALLVLALLGLGPHTGRYRTLTVLSGSMRPGMPEGSIAIVVPEPLSAIKVGQVLAYQAPVGDHHLVSHRVTRVVSGGAEPEIQTKGDANDTVDPWTARLTGDRAWRVTWVIPYGGWIVQAMRNRIVRLMLVDGTPVLLCALWLDRIWRNQLPDPDAPASRWQSVTGKMVVGRPAIRSRFSDDAAYDITRSCADGINVTAIELHRGGCWHVVDDLPDSEWLSLELSGGTVDMSGGLLAVRISPRGDAVIYVAKGEATLSPLAGQCRSLSADDSVRLTVAGQVRPTTTPPDWQAAEIGSPELDVLTGKPRFENVPLP